MQHLIYQYTKPISKLTLPSLSDICDSMNTSLHSCNSHVNEPGELFIGDTVSNVTMKTMDCFCI